jgi:ABC-type spermidine/putrescine transport system permease subunit I
MLGAITNFTHEVYEQLAGPSRDFSKWLNEYLPITVPASYLFLFLLVPIAYTIAISFFEYDSVTLITWTFTTEYYETLLGDAFYRGVLWYTVKLALIVSACSVVFGYPIGYFIAKTTPLRRQLALFAVFLPLMVGTIARVYGWIVLFAGNGIINSVLQTLFGFELELLNNTLSVTVGLFGVFLPLVVLPVYSAIEDMPDSVVPAARNLGANRAEAFLKVELPLSLPGLLSGTIFVFVLTMNSVVTPKLLGGRTDLSMGVIMYDNAVTTLNWPFASATGTVLTITTTVLVYVYFKYVRGRMEVEQ